MVREYPALGITDVRDVSKNSGNPAFAHPNLCPDRLVISGCILPRNRTFCFIVMD